MATISVQIKILQPSCGPSRPRALGNQHAFDILRESELIPRPKATAAGIEELARLASASFGRAVGTCKMGVDSLAVVEPELRVHGILGCSRAWQGAIEWGKFR
jgi:choline dehydrogenase-like flavoprotein